MSFDYMGKIFRISFPASNPAGMKSGELLAITEPDGQGDIESLLILSKKEEACGRFMELPADLLSDSAFLFLDRKYIINKSNIEKELTCVSIDFLEHVLKKIVLDAAVNYYKAIHAPLLKTAFTPDKSRINYAGRIYDEEEIKNLIDSSLEFYLTARRYDAEFCLLLSAYLQTENVSKLHTITVNSGSSANLIALSTLTSSKLGDLALQEDDEVITVSAGFPTSIGPIVQNRLIPVFVDIELGNYNIDTHQIEKAISKRTKAIMIAHTLGIPFAADRVLEIAEKHKLWVIEDNCDALGAEYALAREYSLLKGKKVSDRVKTGTIGHLGTSSFYPAHQITMGEGGAVYTADIDLYRIALSLRDWGRDCWCEPGRDNTCGRRFSQRMGMLPEGYDHKYVYSHLGYNLKITDMQAAIGVAQLHKLPFFAEMRYRNWKYLRQGLEDLEDVFILPDHPSRAIPSPFGFALTLRDEARFSRKEIVSFLEEHNIQTRPVFAGNMLRQPAFAETQVKLRILDSPILISSKLSETDIVRLPNSEQVMNSTFWVGVYPGLTEEMIRFTTDKIKEFCSR
jgi:CDP-4-dehydro-6-deoxyglucose reductase, E1